MSLDGLYEGDSTTQAAVDERLVRSGIETANEVRARRGRQPLPGGDELRMQQQMVPLDGNQDQGGDNAPK
jgi:hypothetical protein